MLESIHYMESLSIKVYGAITHENKVLLLQDLEGTKGWKFTGGHRDPGETLEQALKRESLEEVNLPINVIRPFAHKDFFRPEGSENYHCRLFFICSTEQSDIKTQVDEIAEARWFTLDEIDALPDTDLYPDHSKEIRSVAHILRG
jgi:8-oxo-dGTP pyrophosphatase MutT (NUDIX family)